MKVLIIAPQIVPIKLSPNYQGIERLAREFSEQLTLRGHKVSVVAAQGSELLPGIELIPGKIGAGSEADNFLAYQSKLSEFDIIHDFSHAHAAAMALPNLPVLNMFWHDPFIAAYPEPKYNMIALSNWGAQRFEAIYGQKARYRETIMVSDPNYTYSSERGDRFLTLGKMSPEKGNIEAIRLCRKSNAKLDIAGGTMPGDSQVYSAVIQELSSERFRFMGNVSEDAKLRLLKSAQALLYCAGQTQIHEHKTVEALLCGCPIICYDWGCAEEVGGGYIRICKTESEFLQSMCTFPSELNAKAQSDWARIKYLPDAIIPAYITLYEQVANGLRW